MQITREEERERKKRARERKKRARESRVQDMQVGLALVILVTSSALTGYYTVNSMLSETYNLLVMLSGLWTGLVLSCFILSGYLIKRAFN